MLPIPVALNTWKHHLGFVRDGLAYFRQVPPDHGRVKDLIASIEGSLIDVYLGKLSPLEISDEVLNQIDSENLFDCYSFKKWIYAFGNSYRNIMLSDKSKWTIQLGVSQDRFVHIHPGRYSEFTIRVKASTLKTALSYSFLYGFKDEHYSIDTINKARNDLALLPPMKRNSSLIPVSRLLLKILC